MGDFAGMRVNHVHPPRFACDMNLRWSGRRILSTHSARIALCDGWLEQGILRRRGEVYL